MATVNKNFVVKNGLVIQGSTATVNGNNILTENAADSYILNLIGGETLVKSVAPVFSIDSSGQLALNVDGTGMGGLEIPAPGAPGMGSNLQIKRSVVDTWYDAAGAASTAETNAKDYADGAIANALSTFGSQTSTDITNAITTAENYADSLASNYDAAGAATTALNSAKSYADGLASNYDAAGAASTAETNAKSYADSLASNYDAAGAAATAQGNAYAWSQNAETNAKSYADSLASNYDAAGAAATALTSANTYTDTAVSNVVGLAPAALDTLQELAAAFNNSPDTLTNLITTVGTKQDALTAGEGIYIDNANVITGRQQSGGGLKFVFNEAAIDRSTVDTWYDAAGAASTAETNAKSYADDVAATAEQNAKNYTDSAISSGLNGYVTETGTQTLTNKELVDPLLKGNLELEDSSGTYNALISLSSDELVLDTNSRNIILSPEGGNVYLQNSATLDNALATQGDLNNAIVNGKGDAEPYYKGVHIGNYTELVSGWNSTGNGSAFSPLSWNTPLWGTAKLTVHVRSGIHTQASEVLVARDDNNNLHITEYAIVTTNGSLADISVGLNGPSTELIVTPTAGHDNTEAVASGSVIVWAD